MNCASVVRLRTSLTIVILAILIFSQSIRAAEPEEVLIDLQVVPYAQLEFLGEPTMYLSVPPAGSTIPSSGVEFVVFGNASAALTATPGEFMEVGGQFLGRAIHEAESIGYNINLRFPATGVSGSPIQYAGLPGFQAGPTEPPLGADLTLTGSQRQGQIHLESDPNWTETGGIPLPGIYQGTVTLTLTPNN